jgi:uncharacterized protein (DUF2345 family)
MTQADDRRQQATTALAEREQELADARKKVERLAHDNGNDKAQRATSELEAREQELANARRQAEHAQEDDAEGRSLLMVVACAIAALAGIGLITGAMLALTVDTAHVTTAGVIAAISAGGMLAVVWVAFVVNWYRKHAMPVPDGTPRA